MLRVFFYSVLFFHISGCATKVAIERSKTLCWSDRVDEDCKYWVKNFNEKDYSKESDSFLKIICPSFDPVACHELGLRSYRSKEYRDSEKYFDYSCNVSFNNSCFMLNKAKESAVLSENQERISKEIQDKDENDFNEKINIEFTQNKELISKIEKALKNENAAEAKGLFEQLNEKGVQDEELKIRVKNLCEKVAKPLLMKSWKRLKNGKIKDSIEFARNAFNLGSNDQELEAAIREKLEEKHSLYSEKIKRSGCKTLYNFNVVSKLSTNSYEISYQSNLVPTCPYVGNCVNNQIVWKPIMNSAILHTVNTNFQSSGKVIELSVIQLGKQKVKLNNGFDKSIEIYKESKECSKMFDELNKYQQENIFENEVDAHQDSED